MADIERKSDRRPLVLKDWCVGLKIASWCLVAIAGSG